MIRVSVMANDSLVVDEIASILAQEIALDVLQLTYCLPRNMNGYIRDHDSVFVLIDDGEPNSASQPAPWHAQNDGPLLLLEARLRAIDLDVYQGYPLTRPRMERQLQGRSKDAFSSFSFERGGEEENRNEHPGCHSKRKTVSTNRLDLR